MGVGHVASIRIRIRVLLKHDGFGDILFSYKFEVSSEWAGAAPVGLQFGRGYHVLIYNIVNLGLCYGSKMLQLVTALV